MKSAFTFGRPLPPDTLHIWFQSAPTVQGPRCLSTTTVGPKPHCLLPRDEFVAVGIRAAGPMPQMTGSVLFGEKKMLCTTSPKPVCPVPGPLRCPGE